MARGYKTACIVPTYNGREHLERLLDSLAKQSLAYDLFLVDSSSIDGTRELALSRGLNVEIESADAFNHGGTRQMMVERNAGYDVYIFLTQDVCLEDEDALKKLVAPFSDPWVGAVCGRQLPHKDATAIAAHARLFNYPGEPRIVEWRDAEQLGLKAAFISNSFAAYRGKALKSVGGFPKDVILSEDMHVTARMLLAGWKISYAADALCRHSHNYTPLQEFKMYFDIGVFHAREKWVRTTFGGAGGEGGKYVVSELKFLGWPRFYRWPESLFRNGVKLLGYTLGQYERWIPLALKANMSMHKRFWEKPTTHAGEGRVDQVVDG